MARHGNPRTGIAAAQRPNIGVGRIVLPPPTQPFIDRVQHIVGGEFREDHHTKQMLPEAGSDKNLAVQPSQPLLQCMSLKLAYRDGFPLLHSRVSFRGGADARAIRAGQFMFTPSIAMPGGKPARACKGGDRQSLI
jgi:hypothetical protein